MPYFLRSYELLFPISHPTDLKSETVWLALTCGGVCQSLIQKPTCSFAQCLPNLLQFFLFISIIEWLRGTWVLLFFKFLKISPHYIWKLKLQSNFFKLLKLYGPFLRTGFLCLRATKQLMRRHLTLNHLFTWNASHIFHRHRSDDSYRRPWSHLAVFITDILD